MKSHFEFNYLNFLITYNNTTQSVSPLVFLDLAWFRTQLCQY